MVSEKSNNPIVPPRRPKLRKPVTPDDIADAELRRVAGQTLRCEWAQLDQNLSTYHDDVWGETPADDNEYFERMMLEIFHAGLSWTLIWNKREGFRRAFNEFNINEVAEYTSADLTRLMEDPHIIRSEKKIDAAVTNARMVLQLQVEHGTFRSFLMQMPDGEESKKQVLRKAFKFMGPGVAGGFLHATGLIAPPHHPYCYKVSASD